jgi:hypothetical protein
MKRKALFLWCLVALDSVPSHWGLAEMFLDVKEERIEVNHHLFLPVQLSFGTDLQRNCLFSHLR